MPNFQRYPWNLSLIYMSIVLLLLTVCFHLRFLRKIALCIAQEATEKFTEFNSIWVAVNFRMFYQIKGNVENQELPFFLSLRTSKSYPPPHKPLKSDLMFHGLSSSGESPVSPNFLLTPFSGAAAFLTSGTTDFSSVSSSFTPLAWKTAD